MQKCSSTQGRVHSVETLGALDGPGLRYIVFLQGCALRCQYCHNPDTWSLSAGTQITVQEQIADIQRYKNYLSGGVTVSGGEPLLQPAFVYELIRECHEKLHLHCAIDTSGAVPVKLCRDAVNEADMILLDIKAFDAETASEMTGSDTKNAWALLDYCEKIRKPVWIRHVLVPGKTLFERDSSDTLFADRKDFLDANPQLQSGALRLSLYSCIERIELLPFHKMGEFKWDNMKVPCMLKDTPEPDGQSLLWSRELFTKDKRVKAD